MTAFSLIFLLAFISHGVLINLVAAMCESRVSPHLRPGGQMTEAMRNYVPKVHNDYRSELAKGTAGPGFHSAKNMYKLTYDHDLERRAQQWANQCEGNPDGFLWNSGENFYAAPANNGNSVNDSRIVEAMQDWWDVILKNHHFLPISEFSTNTVPVSSWTQMAWGSTTRIGCGVAICFGVIERSQYSHHILCQYETIGNIERQQIYQIGNGCSENRDCTLFDASLCETATKLCVAPNYQSFAFRMTDALRFAIVDHHNHYRSELAKGLLEGFVRAKNMYKMKYSRNLERQAQHWADQCSKERSGRKCRGSGENTYAVKATNSNPINEADFANAIHQWWDTHKYEEQPLPINNFRGSLNSGKAWSQLAWAKTTRVGCGVAMCSDLLWHSRYNYNIICRYQQGNIEGRQIYEPGNGCSTDSDCTLFDGSICDTESMLCVSEVVTIFAHSSRNFKRAVHLHRFVNVSRLH